MMKGRRASEKKSAPIAPAGSTKSSSGSPEHTSGSRSVAQASTGTEEDQASRPTKRRTVLTTNACLRCRQRKTKCDGKHPTCARCQQDNVQCRYDVEQEGLTKMQHLQHQLKRRDREFQRVNSVLGMLAKGSDEHAAEVLARLRLGESVEDVLARFEDPNNPSSTDSRQRMASVTSQEHSLTSHSAPVTPLDVAWGDPLGPADVTWPPQNAASYQQLPQDILHGQASHHWQTAQWSSGNIDPAISTGSFGQGSGAPLRRASTLESPSTLHRGQLVERRGPEDHSGQSRPHASSDMLEMPMMGLQRPFWMGASPFDTPKSPHSQSEAHDKRKR